MSRRAIVAGGSLGGLTAALLLRDLGWEVDVYERSGELLTARGAGIVAHPASVRYLLERTGADLASMTASSRSVRYLDARGKIVHTRQAAYRFTSFHALYRELLAAFQPSRYHLQHTLVGFEQDGEAVTVELADGRTDRCDLLVCADGIHSTARRLLLPDVEGEYAGYVAWRGVVGEDELSQETFATVHDAITYYLMPFSHILTYPIPSVDGSVEPGRRLVNWIWYRNVAAGRELDDLLTDEHGARHATSMPPGSIRRQHVDAVRAAGEEALAPPLAEMVRKTAEPFVQAVFDVEAPRLAFGRICLIGDAAGVLRPHVAVGTAKAADAAWTLADALDAAGHDVVAALARWEPAQLAVERSVLARARAAGTRSQVASGWRVGDPLPFGLRHQGDSEMRPR